MSNLQAGGPALTVITAEILLLKRQTVENMIQIGRRLLEAKEMVGHGNWLTYLRDRVELSERTAQRFMRAAAEYANATSLADLDPTKALLLLEAPEEDRPTLAQQADTLTTRELEEAVRKANQAQREADEARRRADTAEARARELENRPLQVEYRDNPKQAAEVERLREALDKAHKEYQTLQQKADRNAALEQEIKEKELRLQLLIETEQKSGAVFDEGDRDPEGGLKLLMALHPIDRIIFTVLPEVRRIAERGAGGWSKDPDIKKLADQLRELARILDGILKDRASRDLLVTPMEVR